MSILRAHLRTLWTTVENLFATFARFQILSRFTTLATLLFNRPTASTARLMPMFLVAVPVPVPMAMAVAMSIIGAAAGSVLMFLMPVTMPMPVAVTMAVSMSVIATGAVLMFSHVSATGPLILVWPVPMFFSWRESLIFLKNK